MNQPLFGKTIFLSECTQKGHLPSRPFKKYIALRRWVGVGYFLYAALRKEEGMGGYKYKTLKADITNNLLVFAF